MAIIGAGFGGVAAAVRLKQAGVEQLTIFEMSAGVGGTWWDSRFPGAACDVESHLYSFSFALHDWERAHATQKEIHAYLEGVVDRFDLRRHLRLSTMVREVRWDDRTAGYTLTTREGERRRFDVVVSALGMLNNPQYPDWPGLDEFRGPKFHTARWEEHDLRGKRVAVVGAGSTSAQVVPGLAADVGQLVLFQRTPAWVVPKPTGPFTRRQRRLLRLSIGKRAKRWRVFLATEARIRGVRLDSPPHRVAQAALLANLEAEVPDAELRDALRPDYPFRCKRPVRSSDFYRAMGRDNVQLVARAVERVTARGLVDAAGVEHPVDAIVMATGFQAANLLGTLEVVGRGGRTIHEAWAGEPEAFLGLCYPGFPNFFMLYGPNTNPSTSSVVFQLECQARYVARAARRMVRTGAGTVEVRPRAMSLYRDWLRHALRGTVYEADCANYYRAPTGRVVTNWPSTQLLYWALTKCLFGLAMRFSRPGGRHPASLRRSSAPTTPSPRHGAAAA